MGQVGSRADSSPRRSRLSPASTSRDRDQLRPDDRRTHRPRPLSTLSLGRGAREPTDDWTRPQGAPSRRQSRLYRARNTLTSLPQLFHRHGSSHSVGTTDEPHHSDQTSHDEDTSDNSTPTSPRLQLPEIDLTFDDLAPAEEAAASRPHTRRGLRASTLSDRLSSLRQDRSSTLSDRFSSFRQDRAIRNMATSLRRRSPARRVEDQAAMLSHLLSYAAAATAASLMGGDHRAVAEARSVAGDGEDGTFDSFLQALQNGQIASALRQSGSESDEGTDGSPAPLNFFRMFRFGSPNDNHPRRRSGLRHHSRGDEDEPESRMIPIIIVGIRSITPGPNNNPDEGNIPPFLDALSSFPAPLAGQGEGSAEPSIPQPRNATAFSHRRRASMGGVNMNSSLEGQRHQPSADAPRPWSTVSNSPAGPLPPPSTPASPGLSALSSESSTPAMGGIASTPATQPGTPARRESFTRRATGASLESNAELPSPRQRRQRRMSESDFTRFGSGASRRNGVVEPDNSPGEGSRSWIIYVLGGSYPENHPILTTPSLFSDSPTYEDMLLLSAHLGPAKPPVATQEDVEASGGVYLVRYRQGQLVGATSMLDEMGTYVPIDERCLICLSDFEVDELARRLKSCGHLFHKECIDQWLLTGRNSCPLCRGQGVAETPDLSHPMETSMGESSSSPTS